MLFRPSHGNLSGNLLDVEPHLGLSVPADERHDCHNLLLGHSAVPRYRLDDVTNVGIARVSTKSPYLGP